MCINGCRCMGHGSFSERGSQTIAESVAAARIWGIGN
jgi:hypothetical protein